MRFDSISGVVLAGGQSSRMKLNKAFVKVGGIAIIDRILPVFREAFAETLIISNTPELYEELGLPVYTDIYPRQGPVSGVHAGLFYARNQLVYVQSCDLPFMTPELAGMLLEKIGIHDCAVPIINGKMQPLAGLFKKSLLSTFESSLQEGKLKLTRLIQENLNVRLVSEEELRGLGDLGLKFLNVNDEETLKIAEQRARGI